MSTETKRDGLGREIDSEAEYYVQDVRTMVGNCALWWAEGSNGYTCELEKAGIYLGRRVRGMRDTDIPWPVDVVRKVQVTHVCVEALYSLSEAVLECTKDTVRIDAIGNRPRRR